MRVAGDIHENVAQRAVHQPWRHGFAVNFAIFLDLFERNFELVELIVARFVDARCLTRWPDEQTAEQV